MIWRGKYSKKLFKKIDEHHPLDLREDCKEAEKTNKSCSSRKKKKQMILQHDNFWPYTGAATSAEKESITLEVAAHPPYIPDLALSDFWLFAAHKKHLKGFHFTCDEEIVLEHSLKTSTTTGSKKKCSVLAALYRTRETLRGKWGIETKHTFWAIFPFVSFVSLRYLFWM